MVEQGQNERRMIGQYRLLKVLGDGNFGTGWLSQDTKKENKPVCVKLFKGLDGLHEDSFNAELKAGQSQLFHPNVLRLLGAGKTHIENNGQPEDNGAEHFFIVSELADNGEAFDYVEMAGGLKPDYCRQLFSQLVAAVAFIHDKGVAHRDLKLENCFLDKNVSLKLADFGMMKVFAGPGGEVLQTRCGTPNYMAAEIVGGQAYQGPPVDVFAMGAILFLMRFGRFGFLKVNDNHYKKFMKNAVVAMKQKKLEHEDDILDLLVGMLCEDPQKRYTLDQIKAHPWCQGKTATPQQMAQNFNSLKAENTGDETERQKQLEHGNGLVQRAAKAATQSPEQETVDEWLNLSCAPYFEHNKSAFQFKTEIGGHLIFGAVWEQWAKSANLENDTEPVADGDTLDMLVQFKQTPAKLESCPEFSEDEDEPVEEIVNLKVSITEDEKKQKYVDFSLVDGDRTIYAEFVRNMIKEKLLGFAKQNA